MAKLNQIVAAVSGKRTQADKELTALTSKLKESSLFAGLVKTYETIQDQGEELPPERKVLQQRVSEVISELQNIMGPILDVVFTQETSNTSARADVEVNGVVIISDVPVQYLLFLEKKLTEIESFISKLPVLDPSQIWNYSKDAGCYVTQEAWKYHTKKVPQVILRAPATEHHPAQTEVVHEDKNMGKWKTIQQSGAIRVSEQQAMLTKVRDLTSAVRKAREIANMTDIENKRCSSDVFKYIFG